MLRADSLPSGSRGQWGLTFDNYGRLFFSNAGGENAGNGFQINPAYGQLDFPDAYDESTFAPVWSSISNPDVQGGPKRLRQDSTLNHFTAGNGQSIFRGDRLPEDLRGDYLICEPVARIVRRAKVINREGKIYLENVYRNKEFISSTDFFFRPVNTFTGPDGCLYIIDMNRGIIQESNWTGRGSFLRGKIQQYGLDKIRQRGRIWRLVHDGYKRGAKPKMLDVAASKLIQYLDHPNGWWRDNAQKQIVLLQDRSVIPELKQVVAGNKGISALGRLHALWTLEGLEGIDKSTLFAALKDKDAQVRRAAIRNSEPLLKQNDIELLAKAGELASDENFDVLTQLVLSLQSIQNERAREIVRQILAKYPNNQMLSSAKAAVDKNEGIKQYGSKLGRFAATERKLILDGAVIYKSMCAACHGTDGKGLPTQAAPPLTGAKYLVGDKTHAIKILLNGLKGEVEGKTYSSEMPAMKDNSDEWIASVLSYTRYEFGAKNRETIPVKPDEVKALRNQFANRLDPWTVPELEK